MPDYIDGIYNYCDRWCERCPLTARCRSFAIEQAISERGDTENGDFWEELKRHLPTNPEFEALLSEAAEDAEADDSSFLDDPFDSIEDEIDRAEQSPLAQSAFDYAAAVRSWLAKTCLRNHERLADDPATIDRDDALDVIEWYSLQIGVKLTRAASGQHAIDDEAAYAGAVDHEPDGDEVNVPQWEDDFTREVRNAEQHDRDGSAKVALIGIERSLGAFTILRRVLPAEEATIRTLLRQLARLRLALDHQWPGARTFVRPGFDNE